MTRTHYEMDTLDGPPTCWGKIKKIINICNYNKLRTRRCSCQTHMRSSTNRMFLFNPSMAVISSSEREKSKICSVCYTTSFTVHYSTCMCSYFSLSKTHLEILPDVSGVEALRDDHDSSLHVEPQHHLGRRLVVLFGH